MAKEIEVAKSAIDEAALKFMKLHGNQAIADMCATHLTADQMRDPHAMFMAGLTVGYSNGLENGMSLSHEMLRDLEESDA